MNIKNLKDLVWSVLKENPNTRDDDKILIMEVWKAQGLKLSDDQLAMFFKVAFPETITRLRREIQESGLFRGSKFSQAKRTLFNMTYREKYRKDDV